MIGPEASSRTFVLIAFVKGKSKLMPSNLSPVAAPPSTADPRFQPGAYISDGEALYWVKRATFAPTPMSLRANVLVVEDCRTEMVLELDIARVDNTCTLVRDAPTP
ncbi:MAG TPA: hypothetical protein VG294_18655 [Solirubrobacteraceae bacterium]|nr:hypothetical protein [Solirubrobacteraceae bacterium]